MLTVVGVRHHSPACARRVEHVIRTVRPRYVLIEGPSTMNDRMGELALAHGLPLALYAFAASEDGQIRRGSFYPFASYSPEWIALTEARAVGAEAMFIDLPAQDRAFEGLENLYSDRHLLGSSRLLELAHTLGFENTDTLWDHLFEQPSSPEALGPRLDAYFQALRADEEGTESDRCREAYMAQYLAWAMGQGGDVVVVCGGYHAPVLERAWSTLPAEMPARTETYAHSGIYLVPFSSRRLDAFGGYASGMPSPAFYESVWDEGPEAGAERMFVRAIQALRAKKQRVSPAETIAAKTMAEGLRRLRGHACLLRSDVLDGVAAALLKDALDAPLPWTRRGVLDVRTHPLLVALVEAFSGDRRGRLAKGTPRPPLVDDAHAELLRVGVPVTSVTTPVDAPFDAPEGRPRSHVLHRLRILGIPGVSLTRGQDFGRHTTHLGETWKVTRSIDFDPALIEAAVYGATLEDAARAKLEERAAAAQGAGPLAELVVESARAGIVALSTHLLGALRAGLLAEPDLTELGAALARLLLLVRDEGSGLDPVALREVVDAAFQRGTWLFEGVQGETAPVERGHLDAVVALRDAVRWARFDAVGLAELAMRRARDAQAPAYVRGAGLGLLAALSHELEGRADAPRAEDDALVRAVRSVARPELLGDFLFGVFALAREELRDSDALLGAIDGALQALDRHTFLVALPSLRQAFGYFPPRERLGIAERVLRKYGGGDAMALVGRIDPRSVTRGLELDERTDALMKRFGLETPR